MYALQRGFDEKPAALILDQAHGNIKVVEQSTQLGSLA